MTGMTSLLWHRSGRMSQAEFGHVWPFWWYTYMIYMIWSFHPGGVNPEVSRGHQHPWYEKWIQFKSMKAHVNFSRALSWGMNPHTLRQRFDLSVPERNGVDEKCIKFALLFCVEMGGAQLFWWVILIISIKLSKTLFCRVLQCCSLSQPPCCDGHGHWIRSRTGRSWSTPFRRFVGLFWCGLLRFVGLIKMRSFPDQTGAFSQKNATGFDWWSMLRKFPTGHGSDMIRLSYCNIASMKVDKK